MKHFVEKVKECKNSKEATALLYSVIKKEKEVEEALKFAKNAHKNQYRKSGEPYIVHPILVAALVGYITKDKVMAVAALLHDIVEDTSYEVKDIEKHFSAEVAALVEALTKIVEIKEENLAGNLDRKSIATALSFRKILLASIKDIRALVIKLCDRLHNMLTLEALEDDKKKRIAQETLVVYAPIAHRLGISFIKNLLEDLSFYYLIPKEYKKIDSYIKSHKQELQIKLNHFIDKVKKILIKKGFRYNEFNIISRIKHYYSIYLKMQRKGISIEEVLDLLAIRILVKDEIGCYKALGIIHLNFKPLPMRFKDYIAIPKENGYQTIHTTVFDDTSIFEVQIRTYDMHKRADYGVAAHWKYKIGLDYINLKWLENLQFQKEDMEEFYELIKGNLYSEDISVFSPKGDVFSLPRGAVALDFAYTVHSDIGNCAKEVYINKEKATLLTELKNGDIVRIITSEKPILRCSWLDALKTSKAKEQVKQLCKQKIKEINFRCAINILGYESRVSKKEIEEWIEKFNLKNTIFKAAVDENFLNEMRNLYLSYLKNEKISLFSYLMAKTSKIKKHILENFLIYSSYSVGSVEFDYCCNPKIGDEIIAFKKGSIVTIHHKLCQKAALMVEEGASMVLVKWNVAKIPKYRLLVSLQNKKGALASFLHSLAKLDINVITIELGKDLEYSNICELEIESEKIDIKLLEKKIKTKAKVLEISSKEDAYKKGR